MKFKIILCAIFALIAISIPFLKAQPSVESERCYCLNGEKWNWQLTLFGDGDFQLWLMILSSIPPETKQYYYKGDMLILEYNDGTTLYFKMNSDNDTLVFQESLSYYQKGVWESGFPFKDGSVFIPWDNCE